MKNITILEHNIETNIVVDRPMTNEEFEQFETDAKIHQESLSEKEKLAIEKNDLLVKLGITQDEARLLLL